MSNTRKAAVDFSRIRTPVRTILSRCSGLVDSVPISSPLPKMLFIAFKSICMLFYIKQTHVCVNLFFGCLLYVRLDKAIIKTPINNTYTEYVLSGQVSSMLILCQRVTAYLL